MEEKFRAAEIWETPHGDYGAHSDGMLSYSYSESRQSVDSPFTLSLTPGEDMNGLTWLDKIATFDLVYIEEFGKVRYCGIVHRVRYSARMGEGPERTIMVEGNGFGELLKVFQLVLDTKLFINESVDIENLKAKSELMSEGDTSLERAIRFYYDNFKRITMERGEKHQSVLIHLIEKFVTLKIDKNCKTILPICQSMYQMGVNTLWDIVRKIVPDPMYELFGKWDADEQKYVITVRQNPFNGTDWRKLPSCKINPVTLKEYNVGYDDLETYTVFYGIAPSFGYTNNMAMVVDKLKRNHVVDEERWKKYGYRPMFVELSFLKRDEIEPNDVENSLKKIGDLLHGWYSNNDRFLSGIISVISHEDEKAKYPVIGYPAIGCRLEFQGGEFYIDEIQRKWSYGASPTSEIKVIRGGAYKENSEYSGPIKKLGRRMNEFEERVESGKGEKSALQEAREAIITPEPEQYAVKAGDTLQSIAANLYGDRGKWQAIYYANTSLIDDPDLIHPGTVLKIPRGI
jgi:hypothetical protein